MRGTVVSAGQWLADADDAVPAIWGNDGTQVLWAQGEPLILAGPPGVGKSTVAQQLAIAACGLPMTVLGFPVMPAIDRHVMYIAADRPRQAKRSLKRMIRGEHDLLRIDDRLLVSEGPLPFSVLDDPKFLADWLDSLGVGYVVLDSLKDVAGDVADGNVGAALNSAIQHVIAKQIEVCAIHHPRKANAGNPRPRTLDDLYGSQWIAAGAGSVVYLYGSAGDRTVELLHLKQPAGRVPDMKVAHDHVTGRSSVASTTTITEILRESTTVSAAAQRLFGVSKPSRDQNERARRQLEAEVEAGRAEKVPGVKPKAPTHYGPVVPRDRRDSDVKPSRRITEVQGDQEILDHARITEHHATDGPPLQGAVKAIVMTSPSIRSAREARDEQLAGPATERSPAHPRPCRAAATRRTDGW